MTTKRQKVAPRHVKSDHVFQLFDGTDTLGAAVASFLDDGFAAGANALLIVRPVSLQAIARALTTRGVSLPSTIEAGRLVVVDAAATLLSFMEGPSPNPARFDAVAGAFLRHLGGERARDVRIYAELVDVLATEGNFLAAQQLEERWNRLAADAAFRLVCGCSAAHFALPAAREALRGICASHTDVRSDPSDVLASWLLAQRASPVTFL